MRVFGRDVSPNRPQVPLIEREKIGVFLKKEESVVCDFALHGAKYGLPEMSLKACAQQLVCY